MREQLLMRELILRLRAERVNAPGRSGPPTEYFLREKRRLLFRHPYFAFRYELMNRWWRLRHARPHRAPGRIPAGEQTS